MIKNFFIFGKRLLTSRQRTIFQAAIIIMITLAASRFLGLVRQRVLAHYFSVEDLAIYFAAFRLPETVFDILVSGSLSSAFIPVFSSYISKGEEKKAWYVASVSQNIVLFLFIIAASVVFIFAKQLSVILTPGFPSSNQDLMAQLTRLLLFVQIFFILSFFLTSALESHQRFVIPAIAPLFYNLGIILGAIFFTSLGFGIWSPAIGALLGAILHFAIQLPLAVSLGFRFVPRLDFKNEGVIAIAKLAAPRSLELVAYQILKSVELILASLITVASYTYYTFAYSLQLVPVGLIGVSIAKASLPMLSSSAARDQMEEFRKTLSFALSQIFFFVLPFSFFLTVLRIPLVRLFFGTARFSWVSTVQTGYVVSAFSLGILAQCVVSLFSRAFYALHNTKTPVKVSIFSIAVNIITGIFFVKVLRLDVWSLAFAFSIASIIQALILFFILNAKIKILDIYLLNSIFKIAVSSSFSGIVMFFLLKVLDRSVWDSRLSFLGKLGVGLPTNFQNFVIDTHYTINLFFLTLLVAGIGCFVYLLVAAALKIPEADYVFEIIMRFAVTKIPRLSAESKREPVSQTPPETP